MIELKELEAYCNRLLNVEAFDDYCPNGLQLEAGRDVRRIVSGVTASQALIDAAIEAKADVLLVHHGYFWKGEPAPLTGIKGRRIGTLFRHNLSLLAYHLPLDAHPELGNNRRLADRLGFAKENIVTDPMCSALGYGLEYTYSVMERIRLAALTQNDQVMQPPLMGDVGMYVWKIKEVQAEESVLPEWGNLQDRGIAWEATSAVALLMSGAELLVLRHPDAKQAVDKFIAEMEG